MKRNVTVLMAMFSVLLLSAGMSCATTINLWSDTTTSGYQGNGTVLSKLMTPFDAPCDGCDTFDLLLKYYLKTSGSNHEWESPQDKLYLEIKVGSTLGSATVHASTVFDPTGDGFKQGTFSFAKPANPADNVWLVLYSDVSQSTEQWKFKEAYLTCEPSEVPLPAAAWLLMSGLVGIVGFRKRQSK